MQCGNCNNFFDSEVHIPRIIISCGHTFCEICISNSFNPAVDQEGLNILVFDCFECSNECAVS